jgi:hypothetical protein
MKSYFAAAFMALFLTACASSAAKDSSGTTDAQQAKQAISQAEAAAEKADSVGYLWRDTEQLIKDAKKAVDEKKYEEATSLADEARRQSELAYQQYLDQRDAGT